MLLGNFTDVMLRDSAVRIAVPDSFLKGAPINTYVTTIIVGGVNFGMFSPGEPLSTLDSSVPKNSWIICRTSCLPASLLGGTSPRLA